MANISVTYLSSYLFCKRKLFLENVRGIKAEIPKIFTVMGTIKHTVIDLASRQEKGIIYSLSENNISEIDEKFRNSYSDALKTSIKLNKGELNKLSKNLSEVFKELWPYFEGEAKYRSSLVKDFAQKLQIYGEELYEKFEPKIQSEVFIQSESLELKGKIDRIEVYHDKIIPIELKSGKPPAEGVWEAHLIQTAAYMMLLEEKYDPKIGLGKVHYLSTNDIREIKMNPFMKDEILKLKDKVKLLLNNDDLPDFVSNRKKCDSCAIKEQCYKIAR